jgi:cytochrome P450
MFVAGTDTSSTALEWLMTELIKNPRIMKIDVNDINKMDYLKCILKETLRLHPPLPLLLPRETFTSVKIGGYDIPPKTRIFANVWAIQRDPKIWERPEEFLPERFENNSIDFKGQDLEFIPFGAGRRGCPGLAFGVASVEYVIANILCWLDWKLPGTSINEDLDMSEFNGLTVTKKIPLHLVPILH